MQSSLSSQAIPFFGVYLHPPLEQLSCVQMLPSSQSSGLPGTQALSQHSSPWVQTSPSAQGSPLAAACSQPVSEQVSVVHGLPSSHGSGVPPTHFLSQHSSPIVQASPSSHGTPLLHSNLQPNHGWQLSFVQTLPSSQTFGLPGVHAPSLQWSPIVQTLPSLQGAPSLSTCVQPRAGSQLSTVHLFPSLQLIGWPLLHFLSQHSSCAVHWLPSSHGLPLAATCRQPVSALHRSVVHGLPSSQSTAGPATHFLSQHESPDVQALPSSQASPLAALWMQPPVGSHRSSVQTLSSSQSIASPGLHALSQHWSPSVQALPSSQDSPLAAWWRQPSCGSQMSFVHGLASSQLGVPLPVHWPSQQLSVSVQASSSLQAAPSVFTVVHPPSGAQNVFVHGLPSPSQSIGSPMHSP